MKSKKTTLKKGLVFAAILLTLANFAMLYLRKMPFFSKFTYEVAATALLLWICWYIAYYLGKPNNTNNAPVEGNMLFAPEESKPRAIQLHQRGGITKIV